MSYRSDREIVEAMLPVRFLYEVVVKGADLSDPEIQRVADWIVVAGADVNRGLDSRKIQAIGRRVDRIFEDAIADLKREEAHLAKVGLATYYVLAALRDSGHFHLVDGSPLDRAVEALLGEEGTIVEFANNDLIDRSARKHARRIFAKLQAAGLYRGAEWKAA